jgi:hypothetical protein
MWMGFSRYGVMGPLITQAKKSGPNLNRQGLKLRLKLEIGPSGTAPCS